MCSVVDKVQIPTLTDMSIKHLHCVIKEMHRVKSHSKTEKRRSLKLFHALSP